MQLLFHFVQKLLRKHSVCLCTTLDVKINYEEWQNNEIVAHALIITNTKNTKANKTCVF